MEKDVLSQAPPAIQEGGRYYVIGEDGEKHLVNSYDSASYGFMIKLQEIVFQHKELDQIRQLKIKGFEDLGERLHELAVLWDEEEHFDRMSSAEGWGVSDEKVDDDGGLPPRSTHKSVDL